MSVDLSVIIILEVLSPLFFFNIDNKVEERVLNFRQQVKEKPIKTRRFNFNFKYYKKKKIKTY